MFSELYGDLRGVVTEGIVLACNDAGAVQTIDVQTHDGVIRAGIEVHQAAGFASGPILGGKCILLGIGGDPANMRALPVSDQTRYGNQAPGERTMYAPDGTRVSVRLGGIVEIWGGNQVIINTPNMRVTAPLGVDIVGDVRIVGNLRVSLDITDLEGEHGTLNALRQAYDAHHHPDVQNGPGVTGTTDIPV